MSMFRTAQKLKGAVTLFHDPKIAKSSMLAAYIHEKYPDPKHLPFDIDVVTSDPTAEQFASLKGLARIPPGISPKTLPRPTLVAWFEGKAAVNDIPLAEKILADLAKKED